ncbi:MAG: hypothetical protein J6L72_02810 [Butyricicoccus sp.]|nr:hypothetical protein [Butyricicoccus sp.]
MHLYLVAALTIYDMCKAIDRGMRVDQILLPTICIRWSP